MSKCIYVYVNLCCDACCAGPAGKQPLAEGGYPVATRALLRLVWPASRLTRTPLARRRWQRSIHQREVTI